MTQPQLRAFEVIWTNWYGAKQVRLLEFGTHGYARKRTDGSVRSEHGYADIEEWVREESTGTLLLTLRDGTVETYSSSIDGVLDAIVRILKQHDIPCKNE